MNIIKDAGEYVVVYAGTEMRFPTLWAAQDFVADIKYEEECHDD